MTVAALARLTAATSIAALAALLSACSGDESTSATPGGITTRTPGATATATPTIEQPTPPTPAATPATAPEGAATPTFGDVEPDEVAVTLADLAGEDPGLIAWLLDNLEPRCNENRAALQEFAERTWRYLNETERVAIPVSGILSRILSELPIGDTVHGCEPLFAAVVVELRGR